MAVRDEECRASGCEIPAAWCEAHHLRPWSAGGRTSVDDGVLLCGFHHHRAHDRAYDMTTLGNGDIRFHRRT
jgi:predicted restriction endonuclease